jgi:hypothetical protein
VLSRILFVVVFAAVGALFASPTGVAGASGGGGVTVSCASDPTPGCALGAQTSGSPGSAVVSSVKPQPGDAGTNQTCTDYGGQPAPCVDPTFGWMGTDGCYYKLDTTFDPPAWDTADQPPPGEAGSYYDVTCVGFTGLGTGGGIVWLPAGTAPAAALPAPAVLAAQAAGELTLPGPGIDANPSPGVEQLVGVPTWLWLEGGWQPVAATAAVPGESVTATATPTSVTWSMGDGSTVNCAGPGTPYVASDNPAAASPTCGYTYTTPSVGQSGGAFEVTATITWSITWAGGGQAGTEPALTTTSRAAFRVTESQGINTPSAGND